MRKWYELIYEALKKEYGTLEPGEVAHGEATDNYLSPAILELARRLMSREDFIKLLEKIDRDNHDGLYLLFEDEYWEASEE